MAMSKAEFLPEELIIDILYRLPVKSIGRCRCLSKHWRNFLSDPQFIKLHFNLHVHTQEEKLIIVTWQSELYTITFIPQNGGEIHGISRKVNFQHLSHNWKSVAGSCNGLVLMVGREKLHFLINPTTLKHHQIPMFDSLLPLHRTCYMYGLGYDVVNDDYKVVVLSYPVKNKTVTCVYMYSVRKGLWEKLENSPYDHSPFEPRSGVLVNGALHWLARTTSENSTTIAAFDLSVDKFSEVPRPTDLQNHCFMCNLAPLKGCLCISTNISPYLDTDTFWMMKEYGVKESWTKFKITVHVPLTTLLCSIGDDDVLLDADQELAVYNMKENRRKDLLIDVNPLFCEGRTFVDSLVSPSLAAKLRVNVCCIQVLREHVPLYYPPLSSVSFRLFKALHIFPETTSLPPRGSGKICVHSTLPRPHLVGFHSVCCCKALLLSRKSMLAISISNYFNSSINDAPLSNKVVFLRSIADFFVLKLLSC